MNFTEPSPITALNPPGCELPNRTDQKVGCVESGWLASESGAASPKRTWSWSQPELFHTSLSPPEEPSTVTWHCLSPARMVFDSPSLTSAIVRFWLGCVP